MIKAIETTYKGYRFRSRTEARWAIHLDLLRLPWEYEREGFELDGENYLPDFWLPMQQTWLEIKGVAPNEREQRVAYLLCENTKQDVILWAGDALSFQENKEGFVEGNILWWTFDNRLGPMASGFFLNTIAEQFATTPCLWNRAGRVARSARFEYGETPRFEELPRIA
jgi:hypothetical protein